MNELRININTFVAEQQEKEDLGVAFSLYKKALEKMKEGKYKDSLSLLDKSFGYAGTTTKESRLIGSLKVLLTYLIEIDKLILSGNIDEARKLIDSVNLRLVDLDFQNEDRKTIEILLLSLKNKLE